MPFSGGITFVGVQHEPAGCADANIGCIAVGGTCAMAGWLAYPAGARPLRESKAGRTVVVPGPILFSTRPTSRREVAHPERRPKTPKAKNNRNFNIGAISRDLHSSGAKGCSNSNHLTNRVKREQRTRKQFAANLRDFWRFCRLRSFCGQFVYFGFDTDFELAAIGVLSTPYQTLRVNA